jgi:hypothetical protein
MHAEGSSGAGVSRPSFENERGATPARSYDELHVGTLLASANRLPPNAVAPTSRIAKADAIECYGASSAPLSLLQVPADSLTVRDGVGPIAESSPGQPDVVLRHSKLPAGGALVHKFGVDALPGFRYRPQRSDDLRRRARYVNPTNGHRRTLTGRQVRWMAREHGCKLPSMSSETVERRPAPGSLRSRASGMP